MLSATLKSFNKVENVPWSQCATYTRALELHDYDFRPGVQKKGSQRIVKYRAEEGVGVQQNMLERK